MPDSHACGTSRRQFLHTLGATALATLPSIGAVGANDRVRLGLIGCGGRGTSLYKQFRELKQVEFVAVCDPDTVHMDRIAAMVRKGDPTMAKIRDYRNLLQRDDIDAVIVASPNHWHALHTIHACQAGKDVYVEKPVIHHLSEIEPMIRAAEKHQRIVQAGTQNRSDTGLIEAFDLIRSGELGKITALRGLCYRNRKSIGARRDTPLTPPASCDYDLWLGPAQDLPILRPRLHYDWHWIFNTGDGDIGNQGPHELDLMTWVMGDPPPPTQLRSLGQRFAWNDAGETPNLQTCSFELGGVPAIFEVNNLWVKPDTNAAVAYKGIRVGVIVTCEGGEFRGGRGGGYVVGPDGKERLHKFPGDGGGGHARNFIDAVRSRKADSLNGKLARSCASAALAQYANLSHRSGAPTPAAALRDGPLASSPHLLEVLDRQEAQLERWSIERGTAPYVLGAPVTIDPTTSQVTGTLAGSPLVTTPNRQGYELPSSL
jgi:predicted dehydrogenase